MFHVDDSDLQVFALFVNGVWFAEMSTLSKTTGENWKQKNNKENTEMTNWNDLMSGYIFPPPLPVLCLAFTILTDGL